MQRTATAIWTGNLQNGLGVMSTESGALDKASYSAHARFSEHPEGEPGPTNPEELIAAAHAGCFSMALAYALSQAQMTPDTLQVTAEVSLKQKDGGWEIPHVHLQLTAKVPGASEEDFLEIAQTAKENCPVSKLLKADITLDARLIDTQAAQIDSAAW
ncbi:MAG: OsmC family protein [Bdellovibrionaceae bacterium]|nr:OsmC family protein [Pseudobdellovibrionaceae bacterium]